MTLLPFPNSVTISYVYCTDLIGRMLAGLRGVLDPPVLAAQLLAGVRAGVPHPVAAARHPGGADRTHGQRLLHHGAHHRALPRRLLPIPAQEVSRDS